MSSDTAVPRKLASPGGRGLLAATVCGSAMVFLDNSVVNVALPTIGRDLHAGLPTLQWTINAYTLALASLILLGGSLGDRLGLGRVFVVGVVWFALASLGCAAAPTPEVLVAARALQGVGGALLTPMSLALLENLLRPADRARGIGAWSGATTLATVGAPLVGGALVALDWRWVFAINVPVAAVTLALARRYVPLDAATPIPPGPAVVARRRRWSQAVDVPGAVLGALTLGALTWGLVRAGASGVSIGVVAAWVLAGVAATAFVVRERHASAPIVPGALFRDPTFSATNAYTLLVYAALSGFFLFVTLQLQVSLGYTALAAGASTLPGPVLLGLVSSRSAALAERVGPRLMLTVGALVAAAGVAYLSCLSPGDAYLTGVLPGVLAFGLGSVLFVAPLTATVLAAAPAALAGAASGVNNAVARTAGLIAVAALPALAGLRGQAYREGELLTPAFHTGMVVCAGLLVAGALVAGLTLRRAPGSATSGGPGPSRLAPTVTGG